MSLFCLYEVQGRKLNAEAYKRECEDAAHQVRRLAMFRRQAEQELAAAEKRLAALRNPEVHRLAV